MHSHFTLLALAGLAAAQGIRTPPSATPTAISLTPAEDCLTTCPVGSRYCVAACIGNPSLSSAQVAAAERCYSTCPTAHEDIEDWNAYVTCMRGCEDRYYSTTSTKTVASTVTSGSLAPRSVTATTTTEVTSPIPTTTFPATNTTAVSPKHACFYSCPRGDFDCQTACYGFKLPRPVAEQAAARRQCEAKCGNGTDEENVNYDICILGCDITTSFTISTKATTSTATSGSLARRSGLAAADATTSLSTTTSTPVMSSYTPSIPRPSLKEICLAFCTPGDLQCEIECILA
ncbi:hypothetical protein LTR56_012263 [Elasticomyces elasticus]|nr:hypothetical protein LTR22_021028 [Elasticomyces elasticus]KAK3639688.1 hypothetical protein LTR56_012263 [Elasticomyces elasticus]KAK4922550.1 hypothetical protein LTR49_010075 [Elasticomyces elasticus]KAK5760723.1 hypothetical protein LTS12_009079 [Elasticomyces elasticus]